MASYWNYLRIYLFPQVSPQLQVDFGIKPLIQSRPTTAGADNAPRTHRPASIFDVFCGHEIGRELKAMSQWLDEHRTLLGLVAADLRREGVRETGRHGLPAEAVLRCALLSNIAS